MEAGSSNLQGKETLSDDQVGLWCPSPNWSQQGREQGWGEVRVPPSPFLHFLCGLISISKWCYPSGNSAEKSRREVQH